MCPLLEHPALARHTALRRYAARFALFVGSSPASLLACAGKRALHACEQAARRGAYAEEQALQHAITSLGVARINPRGVGDSLKLRSDRVLLAFAGERADVKMPL